MKMLIDDKRAVLRLGTHSEFVLRLDEFLAAHNPKGLPALVAQAKPTIGVAHALDVDDANTQSRLMAGAGGQDAWWNSLKASSRVKPTFHGIASLPSWEDPTWACEAHRDAHFVAGIWRFPELDVRGKRVPVLPDWYGGLFRDFLKVIESTLNLGQTTVLFDVTATLVGANSLHFARKSDFGNNYGIGADPLVIDNLQFLPYQVEVGTASWAATADRLSKALCGAYGGTPTV